MKLQDNYSIEELLQQVQRLKITSGARSTQRLQGEYLSTFRGSGMQFREVRAYDPADDMRFIDWNVSARMGSPYSKVFQEERERTLMLAIDVSGSSMLGAGQAGLLYIAQIAATLGAAAVANQDKLGAVLFSDKVEQYIPPQAGKKQLLHILKAVWVTKTTGKGSSIEATLQLLGKTQRRNTIVWLLSDMAYDIQIPSFGQLGRQCDAVALHIAEAGGVRLPQAGLLQLQNPETGHTQWIDSASPHVRQQWEQWQERRMQFVAATCSKNGWGYLRCYPTEDYIPVLQSFFEKRRHRK